MIPAGLDEREQAREAIQFHYDVGNRFYELWLDSRMVYSCAMWPRGGYSDDLDAAQLCKLDYHIDQSGAASARLLLDVGCGWGALLARCAERNPVLERAVGLTLSAAQHSYVREHHESNGIECRLEDWHDHRADDPFDSIVSIGAFEHFASPDDSPETHIIKYRTFFEFCRSNLRKGGLLSLQTIGYLNMRREEASKFMYTEIFPNADLPFLQEIIEAAARCLEIVAIRNDRLDYAHTCNLWSKRLKANHNEAIKASDEATVRRYEKYLQQGSVGFFLGKLSLLRITARRP